MIRYLRVAKYVVAGLATIAVAVVAKRALARRPTMPVCDDSTTAIHFGGTRDMRQVRLIVVHSTESDTASSAVNWFANPASEGSAHIVVGDEGCYRTLPDNVVPWGAKGDRANEDGLHVEQAGWAKWSRAEWMAHRATIDRAAAITAAWASEYGIPLVFLTAADLRAAGDGARGITTHREITAAFDVAGGHQDPGADYPMDYFIGRVR